MGMSWNRRIKAQQLQTPYAVSGEKVALTCETNPELANSISRGSVVPLGAELRFQLAREQVISSVALRERGNHCSSFSIYGERGGERFPLYENDAIGGYLYCAFPPTAVSALILVVNSSDNGGPVRLCSVEAGARPAAQHPFRISVYYPIESGARYFSEHEKDPEFLRDLDLITDITVIGDMRFCRDGSLSYDAQTLRRELASLRRAIGERQIRVWCCILNPRRKDGKLSNRDSVHAIRHHLDAMIENILALCEEYALDGIDFDWEYPQLPHVWQIYSHLLTNLGRALHMRGLLLSSALSPWGIHLSRAARESLDFVNVMGYDWPKNKQKHHSEFYTCHYFCAKYFLKKGFKKRQLILGVPFYGKVHYSGTSEQYAYSTFKIESRSSNISYRDGRAYYLNGYDLIYSKTAFTRDMGLAGVMVWCGKDDLPRASGFSLFDAMEQAISQHMGEEL